MKRLASDVDASEDMAFALCMVKVAWAYEGVCVQHEDMHGINTACFSSSNPLRLSPFDYHPITAPSSTMSDHSATQMFSASPDRGICDYNNRYQAEDAEITLISSDGYKFKAHRGRLIKAR